MALQKIAPSVTEETLLIVQKLQQNFRLPRSPNKRSSVMWFGKQIGEWTVFLPQL